MCRRLRLTSSIALQSAVALPITPRLLGRLPPAELPGIADGCSTAHMMRARLLLLLAAAVATGLAAPAAPGTPALPLPGSCPASMPFQPLTNILGGNLKIFSATSAAACRALPDERRPKH